MTNVTLLLLWLISHNKMQNVLAAFLARQGGWQTYEMCSILPDCKRWAQFDAFIQYVHYTYHYDTCNICANMTYMLQIHSAITLKKILARRAWSYRRTRTAAVSRLDLLLKVLFDDSIQNACTIFTIPPPLCFGRPISFMVLVNCKSIASQSINRADTRSHLTAPD